MLKRLRKFSRNQKIFLGIFILAALLGTLFVFLLPTDVLVVALFWLLPVIVLIVILADRRLNAKITRVARGGRSPLSIVRPGHSNRLNSKLSLAELEAAHKKRPSTATALPLAQKLVAEKGSLRAANEILESVVLSDLSPAEEKFVRRTETMVRYLSEEFELPEKHHSYNYLPVKNKVMYAVTYSPLSANNGYTSRTRGFASGLSETKDVFVAPMPGKPWDTQRSSGAVKGQPTRPVRRFVETIDGIGYAHNPGLRAWEAEFDEFFQVSADAYVREALIQKPEFIIAASNYLVALPALMAARRLGVPFVYEMRGFWEVTAASKNPEWANTDKYALDRKFDELVAHAADAVLTITEEMKQDLVSRGIPAEKIRVVPNGVDPEKFIPYGKDLKLLTQLGVARPELPVVGFAGSVTDYEGLDLVAESLAQLKKHGKEFNFLVIGQGGYLDSLKERVETLDLVDRTRFVTQVPNNNMPVYLSSIDIFPLARKSLPVTELVSPLKPLEAMSSGGAVLLSDVSPHKVFYGQQEDRALSFQKNDVETLTAALEQLIDDNEYRRVLGTNARRWIKKNRTWPHLLAPVDALLINLRTEWATPEQCDEELGLKDLNIAFIGDTFTSETFVPELTAYQVTPENWREVYADHNIDALFIESAWQGNNQAWERIVPFYSAEENAPLAELISHSRSSGIPVLFWNKEDPVHFNRFKYTAAQCDYVFTTDARTIPDYLSVDNNVTKVVASSPFSAQPILHNPLPSTRDKQESIAYGGTYYGDKYSTRKQGLDFLFYESAPHGLTIYERVHNDPNSPYRLPDRFRRYAAPSLTYPEMCQAYKAHPIHLNGNSVVESPSMFSRRVVEISASGSVVLSAQGRGVDEVMAGTVATVETPDEANEVLHRWKVSEQSRHEDARAAMRHVFEAHTSAHHLVYMLRVVGFRVHAPSWPKFAVETASQNIAVLENQRLRPDFYVVPDKASVKGDVASRVISSNELNVADELESRGIRYIIRLSAEDPQGIDSQLTEDLVLGTLFGDFGLVATREVEWKSGDSYVPLTDLAGDYDPHAVLYRLDKYRSKIIEGDSVEPHDGDLLVWQYAVDEAGPESGKYDSDAVTPELSSVPDSTSSASKTVLVAGHDLKFMPQIIQEIEQAGHTVLVDQWEGHTSHDEEQSKRLLDQADVVFCEWSLGNVVWFSHHKQPGQKLLSRFHAQELRTRFMSEVNLANVDKFLFVSPVGMKRAQVTFGVSPEQSRVIGNTFDFSPFDFPRQHIDPKTLGFVGSVPQSKRLDLALDIIESLATEDPEYRMVVKGREYSEYPWIQSRAAEKNFFTAQYERIEQSEILRKAVVFEGHSSNLAEWYRTVPGIILSTSDHEGTHQVVAEGGAAGCVPIIFPWAGAEMVYDERWVVTDVAEAVSRIRAFSHDQSALRAESAIVKNYMFENFHPSVIARKILDEIED